MLGHHWPAEHHLSGIWNLSPHQLKKKKKEKNKSEVDPLWQNFLDLHMIFMWILVNALYNFKPDIDKQELYYLTGNLRIKDFIKAEI